MGKARMAAATAAPTAGPAFVEVDPADLVIGANVRLDPRLDREFVASVRERGVLQPIVAHSDGDGRLVVVRGQRRTLAAVQCGRAAVPVWVVPADGDAEDLVDQLVENDHREGLTAVERVQAYAQLAAFGLSAAQIAKRTAAPRARVDAALAVARSDAARAATATHALTLEQAATVAEFEDDPDAVQALVAAAERGHGFEHQAQGLRDKRAEAAAIAAVVEQLAATGVKVIERWADGRTLDHLAHDGVDLTAETHAACAGHAAWVLCDYEYDNDEQPADEDAPDPGQWKAHPVFVCTDPATHGHTYRDGRALRPADPAPAADDTDRQAATAERRQVIENNRAWTSAETVRRDWLRAFLARKTAPKGTMAFIAGELAWCHHAIRGAMDTGNKLAHDLLGLGDPPGWGALGARVAEALGTATDGRAQLIAVALVLAAHEQATNRDSWRRVDPGTARYLRWIEAQGYELSDVEVLACGGKPKKRKARR